jgi:hypothetical protein
MDGQLVELGPIVLLQVQLRPLKVGEKPNRIYDPQALRTVPALTLTVEGVEHRAGGTTVFDVHHRQHPDSRLTETGENAISIGFTAHYAQIRQRFGHPAPLGCGGENILVDHDHRVSPGQVMRGLVIRRSDGQLVPLVGARVAAPCRPFAGYLFGRLVSKEDLKAGVAYLDQGMRGYYSRLEQANPATVEVGDYVYALAV